MAIYEVKYWDNVINGRTNMYSRLQSVFCASEKEALDLYYSLPLAQKIKAHKLPKSKKELLLLLNKLTSIERAKDIKKEKETS